MATRLQGLLADGWLHFSVDDLIDAIPVSLETSADGVGIGAEGSVQPGDAFRRLEAAWMQGIGAMVRAGANVIVDDVFLGGMESRRRWEKALAGLQTLWVGLRCDASVAAKRERSRPDRVPGMAERQAGVVHVGMVYDLEVDTSISSADECARRIAERVRSGMSDLSI